MKLAFRWYGESDKVKIEYIRQIPGMRSIVSAVYDVPPGEIWPESSIENIVDTANKNGLIFDVVESVPVHEDIKLGKDSRDIYIENYIENIRRLAKYGVKVICYNFMPVFDWTRTQLDKINADGSTSLIYESEELQKMDPFTGDLALPGWDVSYTKESLVNLINEYRNLGSEKLWENLEYFLKSVIPVCEEVDIKMAIHPDDPPWDMFGIPRIITNETNLDRFLNLYDSQNNGLTFCLGSLGCAGFNDIVKMADKYSCNNKIHFLHFRNVKILDNGDFKETAHLSECGDVNMVGVLETLHRNGFDGYIRPDHGRMIWGEEGRPGYGLYDRALGAVYANGIWETLDNCNCKGDCK